MTPLAQSSSRRSTHGFTLVEVVLAMGILTLGMTALLGMFTTGAALTREAQMRTTSAATIESVLADLEVSLFPLLADGTVGDPSPIVDRPVPGAPQVVYDALATPNPEGPLTRAGQPLEYRVDVTLRWQTRGLDRTKTLTTLLLREVPFGERMRRRWIRHE